MKVTDRKLLRGNNIHPFVSGSHVNYE
jgi:hypothetical protein